MSSFLQKCVVPKRSITAEGMVHLKSCPKCETHIKLPMVEQQCCG